MRHDRRRRFSANGRRALHSWESAVTPARALSVRPNNHRFFLPRIYSDYMRPVALYCARLCWRRINGLHAVPGWCKHRPVTGRRAAGGIVIGGTGVFPPNERSGGRVRRIVLVADFCSARIDVGRS